MGSGRDDVEGSAERGCRLQVHDAVSYQGSSYLPVLASTGKKPAVSPSDWAVLAQAGGQGRPQCQGRYRRGRAAGPEGDSLLPRQLALCVGVPVLVSGGGYGFSAPRGIAFDGSHLWIANLNGGTVTVIQG